MEDTTAESLDKTPVNQTTSTSTSSQHGDGDAAKETETAPGEDQDAREYVEGFKLAIVIASVALSCFLMLLDTMIISTVSP
jgi:hypothetical protein